MDIKYTIEILTKDIQDIEKLVGNLQNSKEASAIELDLAMSKLRKVYEILTMIKADQLNELVDKSLNGTPVDEHEPEPVSVHEPVPEHEPVTETEPVSEPEPVPEHESVAESEPVAELEPVPEHEPVSVHEPVPEPEPTLEAEPDSPKEPASDVEDKPILAEKFHAESSINENLAGARGEHLDTKLIGQAIDNIGRNIGINDRFLIIRELFDGNSDDFSKLLSRLDTAENYQMASELLKEQFAGSLEHEGVEILAGLVKRRHLR